LSGTLFVVAFDPSLHEFEATIEGMLQATIRAFADDVGAALQALGDLAAVANIFDVAEKLRLEVSKCVIAPIGTRLL